ncbi:uncharacterized protein [Onthophagus taurus]|uniref:uncharacterized protein n=1 Tax=Onthophagus taurus TaxID=166361 RepID=UPI0039BE85DA
MFACDKCQKSFSAKRNLDRHTRHSHTNNARNECSLCDKSFSRFDNFQRHKRLVHGLEVGPQRQAPPPAMANYLKAKPTIDVPPSTSSAVRSILQPSERLPQPLLGDNGLEVGPQRQAPPPAMANCSKAKSTIDVPPSTSSTSAVRSILQPSKHLPQPLSGDNRSKLCDLCGISFMNHMALESHLRMNHTIEVEKGVEKIATCYKDRVASYKISGDRDDDDDDISTYLARTRNTVGNIITSYMNLNGSVKVQLELLSIFIKTTINENGDETVTASEKNFNTKFEVITQFADFIETYDEMVASINHQAEEFQERGSGWAFFSISYLLLNINKFQPIPGSSYIPLPESIATKKACINIKNYDDNACLAWSLVSHLRPVESNRNLTSSYPHFSTVLNLKDINFPVHLKDIPKIEQLNNLSINIYELVKSSKEYVVEGPIYFTKNRRDTHINLLYLYENGHGHYVLIVNLSRLISKQVYNHGHSVHLCDGCLTRFSTQKLLNDHQLHDCNHIKTILPSKNVRSRPNFLGSYTPENILQFNNYKNTQNVPFVIYADFESILKPVEFCEPSTSTSFTEAVDIHMPYSFAYYIVSTSDVKYYKFETYTGLDCGKVFVSKLIEDVKFIYNEYLKCIKPMLPLTAEEELKFNSASLCHICKSPFDGFNQNKVHDHCHITGRFRGAAHSTCNLNFKLPNFIPIFLHNFSGYDSHLFVKELADIDSEGGIDVLPNNKEKYISFSKNVLVDRVKKQHKDDFENVYMKMRFVDSFRFMASSLDSLASNLVDDDFIHVKKFFIRHEQFKLLTRKGIFPYQYIDSIDRLGETSLPSKDAFMNKLSFDGISEDEYNHAQTVWRTFGCQNLREYSDLYLKTDVLLLADIFEKFREVCFSTYGLDPAHYYTAPGLSWDAMLKFTQIKLELLTDIDQVHFIKKGIRGGISFCGHRHAKGNNKYMADGTFNTDLPSNYLMYWDANNLYGWAMSQYMPVNEFVWLDAAQIGSFEFRNVSDTSDYGYILNVDIEYPRELHDLHNDLPFLAENICPPNSKSVSDKRLIPNLFNKKNYVIHYRNLNHAVAHGLIVRKINRILSFKQSAWLKPYIDVNTHLRQTAKNSFEKDFFKLMNNAVFGKTMENVDKRVDVRLVTSWEDIGKRTGRPKLGARSLIAKLNFKNIKIFTETFSAIQMEHLHVVYDKPLYVGFAVLEISKLLMYQFYYDFLKPKFGSEIQLCYMDTDSFTVSITTDDVYAFVKDNLERFDTSNYLPDNEFSIPLQNKAVLGLMKDENSGRIMSEFIGLRSKLYANRVCSGRITKKAKGVKKAVVKRKITFEHYLECLTSKRDIYMKQYLFRSQKHSIYTMLQNKLALSSRDSKRYINDDGVSTLAWGHYRINTPLS